MWNAAIRIIQLGFAHIKIVGSLREMNESDKNDLFHLSNNLTDAMHKNNALVDGVT